MQYIVPVASYTNYSIVNITNLYNYLYITLSEAKPEDRKNNIEKISLILGKSYKQGLKQYIFDKFPKADILKEL